jgi:hypothetical protein
MFYNIPENVVICINESITGQKILSKIPNKKCSVIPSSSIISIRKKYYGNDDAMVMKRDV